MKYTLKIWRQDSADGPGRFETYRVDGISGETSFLEMLDVLNEQITEQGGQPIAFDSD